MNDYGKFKRYQMEREMEYQERDWKPMNCWISDNRNMAIYRHWLMGVFIFAMLTTMAVIFQFYFYFQGMHL